MKREKIYLGNTLIHDEKEYNEMKESISTLKTNFEGVIAPVTYTGSVYENNGYLTYNFYGDNPLNGNLKKLKPGDILQLFQLSESGEELSSNTYTILNGSDNSLTGSEDHKAVLMLNNFNELLEIRTNYIIHKTSSETWYFTNSSDGKLVPQNPVNSSGITIMNFNDVKPGDIFKIVDIDESFTTYCYVLTDGKGYYDATSSPIRAVTVMSTYGNISGIGTDGSIVSVSATKLNDRMSTVNTVFGVETIPVRNEEGGLNFVDTIQEINLRTLTTQGWYRVYQSDQGHNVGQSIKLNINTAYNLHRSCSYTFEINLSYDNVSINQFASINSTSNMIDMIRVLRKDHDKVYVDIHYAYNENNNVYLNIQGIGTVQFLEGPTIPDGFTNTEFSTTDGFKSQIGNIEVSYSKTINGSIKISESGSNAMTTDQFLTRLGELGGFENSKHITFICSHSYANNDYIASPVGNISLSGAIINIYCKNWNTNIASGWALYQIDINTATINNNIPNAYSNTVFRLTKTATNNYIWSRLVNSNELPLKGVNNNVTNFTAIPINKKVVYGTFSSDVTLNLTGNILVGDNMVVLMKNSSTANKTISLTNYPNRNVDTLTVPAGELAEINFLAIGTQITNYYVRGVLYKD